MKAIKYTMTNGLEAQVAVIKTVEDTLETIKSDMADITQYQVVEIEEQLQDESTKLKARLEHLESTLEELLFGAGERNRDEEPII